jgi:hypothetical protein
MSYRQNTSGTVGHLEDITYRLRSLERFGRDVTSGRTSYNLAVANGYPGTYEEWLTTADGSVLYYGSGPPS